MKKIIFIILITLSGRCFGQTFSANQVRQIQALMKPADDWASSQIMWLRAGKTADSLRINSLEKRVTVLEDFIKKDTITIVFDTANCFKATKIVGGYLLQLKTTK